MNLANRLVIEVAKCRKIILVIGDRMVDRWVIGQMMPSQDGCDKFVQDSVVEVPGGAANARRTLSHWNVRATLHSYALDIPIKCRYLCGGEIVFRVDREREMRGLTPDVVITQHDALTAIRHASAVLLSDYDKGFLTRDFIRQVVAVCRQRGIPCVADCKRSPEVYDGCVLKGNVDYQHSHNQSLGDLVFDAEQGQRLVVTCGGDNPIVWDGDGPLGLGYDLPRVNCVNHVGAGDCFAAHLTLALAYGYSLKDAAALAHSAGRVYVQQFYNEPPHPDQIAADLEMALTSR